MKITKRQLRRIIRESLDIAGEIQKIEGRIAREIASKNAGPLKAAYVDVDAPGVMRSYQPIFKQWHKGLGQGVPNGSRGEQEIQSLFYDAQGTEFQGEDVLVKVDLRKGEILLYWDNYDTDGFADHFTLATVPVSFYEEYADGLAAERFAQYIAKEKQP